MDTTNYWNEDHKKRPPHKHSKFIEEKEVLFPRNAKVLDLGGGKGADAKFMNSKGHDVTILDISDLAKNEFEKFKLDVNYIVHDIADVPYNFSGNMFDVVYSHFALHYFNSEEMVNIYKEIFRILKDDGVAYIAVKSPNDLKEMTLEIKNGKEIEKGFFLSGGITKARFSKEQIEKQLTQAGIRNYTIQEINEKLVETNKHGHKELLETEIIFNKQ